jgi:isocitrate/isopropylmalate dehydrogenase
MKAPKNKNMNLRSALDFFANIKPFSVLAPVNRRWVGDKQ